MLENERIIVQDRGGIDAGIAALMQNANKGFDPAALMAMMNNGNGMFGGNGGWWWIFIIVLFWMWGGWGGNGFGRGNQAETNSDFARLAAMGNQNNNTDLLMQAINGNKDAINTLSTNLNCDVKSIAIGESTENVVLGICPKVWCRLPKEGVIVLEVRHTAEASGASLPVFISVSGSVSTASNTRNIPLVNASSEPITGSQVSAGNRYIAYFNKCDNVIQLMNYTPAPAA